jgi:Bardet-Biedl syndrome 2 protein
MCLKMADGANAIAIGSLGSFSEPVAVIGGNCAITAINKTGEEILWTVTGDNVSALSLFDFNNSGQNELIVGSEDSDLRVFRHDEIIAEMSETAVCWLLMLTLFSVLVPLLV